MSVVEVKLSKQITNSYGRPLIDLRSPLPNVVPANSNQAGLGANQAEQNGKNLGNLSSERTNIILVGCLLACLFVLLHLVVNSEVMASNKKLIVILQGI